MAAQVTANTANVCPACAGATNYEQSIECCDANSYAYLNCGGGTTNAQWDSSVDLSGGTAGVSAAGAECLIHATGAGPGPGPDILDYLLWPSGPARITAGSGTAVWKPGLDEQFDRDYSDHRQLFENHRHRWSTIVGFLQAFVNCVEDGVHKKCDPGITSGSTAGDINIQILNVIGCSSSPSITAPPVTGGNGTSPIPVRLITPP